MSNMLPAPTPKPAPSPPLPPPPFSGTAVIATELEGFPSPEGDEWRVLDVHGVFRSRDIREGLCLSMCVCV